MTVVIIGGGIVGLGIAWELGRRGVEVTVLERGEPCQGATWAAGGMLAPTAEGLTGELLQLSLQSLQLYPKWIADLQRETGIDCGYWCCGMLQPSTDTNHPQYLDRAGIEVKQKGLGSSVQGALWLPEDGQVDNRQLGQALVWGIRSLGVQIKTGVQVHCLEFTGNKVSHLATSAGKIRGDIYVLATGAWTQDLLPLPVTPRKGQMIAVFDPDRALQRVIYGQGIYIIPRQDGRIVIGATVEDVGFQPGNTAGGIAYLLQGAINLYPGIATMPIIETWWGFRPYLPNEELRLGRSEYENLYLALGHYRNGILLAPITGKILADQILADLQ
ncbi:MAG: glycine oxidase ThiO [Pseudanabaenaceae cyanobacterium]